MRIQNLGDSVRLRRNEKYKELEELAKELELLRASNKKVVHCHGVFDLLHVGHIRHLKEAKELGDILIVTVTPDRYVNKGPHRPAFTEDLRAEALASLDCVDYVAINQWPTAVDTLRLLKPDFYVKGPDYQNPEKDHTGGINLEEEAVNSVGGKLIITEDVTFSSSNLINRYTPVFSKEVKDYLEGFSSRYSSSDVLGYLKSAQSLKVLVVGEAIIDEYQYCDAIGKSSKDPMLALRRLSTETFAGGVLAAANHLADFSDEVGVLTFLGEEKTQENFVRQSLHSKVKPHFLYRRESPTIVKRRFVENYFFTKLLEVYEINDAALVREDNEALLIALKKEVSKYDVVIVLDFGHSMLTKEAIDLLCQESKFLSVNAQSNAGNLGYNHLSRYPRADYICMAEHELRLEARDRRGDLKGIVLDVAEKLRCDRITVTCGKRGSLCYHPKEGFCEAPALAGEVIDRMGAGDAVLSLTTLCVAQKAPMEVTAFVGNVVGAEAVATVGHRRFIERALLFKHIESLLK